MEFTTREFGEVAGEPIYEYTLTNSQGLSISAMNYGAAVTSIRTPDKNGQIEDVVLAFDNIEDYVEHRPYYGATVGRVAGRIDGGHFQLEEEEYQLDRNKGNNHLHGGTNALDNKIWKTDMTSVEDEGSLIFTCTSPDGESGYPGEMTIKVTFTLTEANEWKINYEATTDKKTLFNPTNHVYFNLTGDHSRTVLQHELTLNSNKFAELREDSIPTGELLPVQDTPFDFTEGQKLKKTVESEHQQIKLVDGLDHPFVLNHDGEMPEATLFDQESGRRVRMQTDRDAVVVFMNNDLTGKYSISGKPVEKYSGVTLETQQLPDAINLDNFGNIVLNPGETFHSETVYQFDTVMD